MVYRIRYVEPEGHTQTSETIEAHSPAEAMVKFSVTHRNDPEDRRPKCITSVSIEESAILSQW